ncbi:MAG: hypothetical protein ACYTFI_13860 [Planctomycetota bacterium]|jgi:ketosteroid isomerase-like protein
MAAYREFSINRDMDGMWSLLGEEHRARFSGGVDDLKGGSHRLIADVAYRDIAVKGDSAVCHATVIWSKTDPVEKGGRTRETLLMKKRGGRWLITRIGPSPD